MSDYEYAHPAYHLKVGFDGRPIYKPGKYEWKGKTVQGRFRTGIILIKGELKQRITRAIGERVNDREIDDLIIDCYSLMIEYMKGVNYFAKHITPHIYVAEAKKLARS